MRALCGAAAEYLGCYTRPYELESGGQEIRVEGSLFKLFGPVTKGSEQKYIYRPLG